MTINTTTRTASTISSSDDSTQSLVKRNRTPLREYITQIANHLCDVKTRPSFELSTARTEYSSETEKPRQGKTGNSLSTSDAINFKLIHYEAALRVIDELLEDITTHRADSTLRELSALIDRNVRTLREKQLTNVRFDNQSVRSDIGGKQKRRKLTDVLGHFNREQTALIQTGIQCDNLPESTRHVHIRTALACMIHGRLRHLGIEKDCVSVAALDKQIFDQYVDILQSRPWYNIEIIHELKFPDAVHGMRTLTFQTTMTPAKNMDEVLAQDYQMDGVNGICSYSIYEQRHAVNLWRTEFGPTQVTDHKSLYVFSGLRHGVHDAYGISETKQREVANDARVREFLHAAVLDHMERNGLKLEMVDTDRAMEIDIVSVNLLTPFGEEMGMIEQQQAAFSRANGVEITIPVADDSGPAEEITIKPRIIVFNTPVNSWALGQVSELIGVWRRADAINKVAIKTLIGSIKKNEPIGGVVAICLESLNAELTKLDENDLGTQARHHAVSRKIKLIEQLVDEIRTIFSTNSHHRIENEPYKLPTRLLALANETGMTPAYNCKSGKDRTGQLNVEIRDLYAHLNATDGKLRKVNTRREEFARENFLKIFVEGGDREIQVLNTGVAGSKAQLHYYNKLMGIKPGTIDEIKGLSKWVGA